MKKLLLVLLFLFMLPLCKADLYSSKFLVLNADISTEFEIESDKITPEIEFITANFSFFPKDFDNQKILSNYFYPPPRNIKNGVAEFEWRNPIEKKFTIDIKSKAMVESSKIKIRSKVKFPIKWLPEEIKRYTLPTETIDINDAIAEKASEIASGKDDLFDVVDSIAYWVNSNIKYNVSTTTAEASQKSSWVFKNREGVCDEITSLFISMLRSLGIPARFVAGIAYTESPDFKEKWGPHGWAEVYFPDYGWVPYDVTYAEYGWVDATHIKATELDDIGKAYTSFSWKAEEGVNLKPSKVKTAVTIESIGNEKEPEIMIESKIYDNDVGFGSYNAVIVTIENLEDYYISKDFYIAKTSSIDIVGEQRKHVLLRPDEIKQIYWILKVDENLDKKYLYTFPIEVLTLDNISTMTEFKSVYDEEVFSLEEIENAIADIEKESEKVYSKNFEINCTTGKKEFYIYERPLLDCTIKNLGNILLKDLALCLNEECRLMTIGIT
ncbi:MAG: transglutaminase-like domain-containing protein, partial [Candidatus Woesearchaeota archaeon]|nr:transglutaminase-like domain-containing protein [Candidatus Woesearchaeota archaeon]